MRTKNMFLFSDIMEFFVDNEKFGEVKTDTIKNSLLNGRTVSIKN